MPSLAEQVACLQRELDIDPSLPMAATIKRAAELVEYTPAPGESLTKQARSILQSIGNWPHEEAIKEQEGASHPTLQPPRAGVRVKVPESLSADQFPDGQRVRVTVPPSVAVGQTIQVLAPPVGPAPALEGAYVGGSGDPPTHEPIKARHPELKASEAKELAAVAVVGDAPFVAAASFAGLRPGYMFKNGVQGVGYYKDTKAIVVATAVDTAAPSTVVVSAPVAHAPMQREQLLKCWRCPTDSYDIAGVWMTGSIRMETYGNDGQRSWNDATGSNCVACCGLSCVLPIANDHKAFMHYACFPGLWLCACPFVAPIAQRYAWHEEKGWELQGQRLPTESPLHMDDCAVPCKMCNEQPVLFWAPGPEPTKLKLLDGSCHDLQFALLFNSCCQVQGCMCCGCAWPSLVSLHVLPTGWIY